MDQFKAQCSLINGAHKSSIKKGMCIANLYVINIINIISLAFILYSSYYTLNVFYQYPKLIDCREALKRTTVSSIPRANSILVYLELFDDKIKHLTSIAAYWHIFLPLGHIHSFVSSAGYKCRSNRNIERLLTRFALESSIWKQHRRHTLLMTLDGNLCSAQWDVNISLQPRSKAMTIHLDHLGITTTWVPLKWKFLQLMQKQRILDSHWQKYNS